MTEPLPSFTIDVKAESVSAPILAVKSLFYIEKIQEVLSQNLNKLPPDSAIVISYSWADEAKQVSILLRDCTLNLFKLKYLLHNNKTEQEANDYKQKICSTITKATNELDINFKEIIEGKRSEQQEWIHETNPVHVVLNQLNTLEDQIKRIQRSEHKIDDINKSFKAFNLAYKEAISQRQQALTYNFDILSNIHTQIQSLGSEIPKSEVVKLTSDIDAALEAIEERPSFSSYENIVLEDTDRLSLPFVTLGGRFQYKNIDILSEVSTWSSFNLTSPLRSIDRKVVIFLEKVNVVLLQLSNRLKAKVETRDGNTISFSPNELRKSLAKLMLDYEQQIRKEIFEPLDEILQNLYRYINVSQLFNDNYSFLPISKIGQLTSGISYMPTLEQRYEINAIKQFLQRLKNRIFTKNYLTNKTSLSEYINGVLGFNPDSDSNSLFMRKGFLGSSFFVRRPILIEKIENHFKLWQSGFGGSLLISGSYGSGKSALIELIPLIQSSVISYHIVQGQSLDINGNKIHVDNNLIAVIKHVIKNKSNDFCILTIDDLSHYSHSSEELFDLMNTLLPLVQRNNQNIYFALSFTQKLENRLRCLFDLDKIFTEIIRTDNMAVEKIEEALLMRAHAVADHDEIEFNSSEMRQKSRSIANISKGNIGFAMQLWCMEESNFNLVKNSKEFSDRVLDNQTMLNHLIMYDKQHFPSLKNIFDEVEIENTKAEIDYLAKQKIVMVLKEGYVTINPYLRHLISDILNDNSILNN